MKALKCESCHFSECKVVREVRYMKSRNRLSVWCNKKFRYISLQRLMDECTDYQPEPNKIIQMSDGKLQMQIALGDYTK